MNDDALRERLARLDPAAAPVDPVTSPRAQELLERTMDTDLDTPATAGATRAPAHRRTARVALAAAAAAALGLGGTVLLAGGDEKGAAEPTQLALALPDPTTMSSCLVFSTDVLRDMPLAFAATVSAVEGDTVTLDVTRWYKGGSADVVVLDTPGEHTSASLDSVAFEDSKAYLVTATEGKVNGCGFSGPATAELSRSFDEAFAG